MPNQLSNALLAEMFGQTSSDPYLMLVSLSHSSFPTVRLVNNTVDIVSRGQTFIAFPMNIRLPGDDGETAREVTIEFDNVSRELIDELRSVTTAIDVKIETVLASDPDQVQMSIEDLKMRGVTYDLRKVSAKLFMDNFLNTALTSEKYDPQHYPGIF